MPSPADRPVRKGCVIAHVGVSVTDLDRAVRWYCDVLGFELLAGPITLRREHGHGGRVAGDVFGEGFEELRQAHLIGANATGVELFEFVAPAATPGNEVFAYWKASFTHICVVDPDPDRLAETIASTGGRQRSAVWDLFPGEPYRMVYCEDPFGNVIEVYSHGYERIYANRPPAQIA